MKLEWTGLVLPPVDVEILDAMKREEPRFSQVIESLSDHEVGFSALTYDDMDTFSSADIIRIGTHSLPTPLRDAVASIGPYDQLTQDEVIILAAFETAPGRDPDTRRRRGRNLARYQIWESSSAEFEVTLTRLAPVIDVIIRQPNP